MNEELGLVVVDSKVVVSSRVVAEVFGKEHKDVLRAIRNLETTEEFRERNFAPTQEVMQMPTGGVRQDPMYFLTRDGFTILAMGFTGPKAMQFKEANNAFNRMEAELRDRHALKAPQTYPEALRALAEEYEQRAIAEAERDKAVREKAWISEKREATAMGKLSAAVKKITDQENRLGEGREWKSVRAIEWLLWRVNSCIQAQP
jgi:Rha family phage regulatory protein